MIGVLAEDELGKRETGGVVEAVVGMAGLSRLVTRERIYLGSGMEVEILRFEISDGGGVDLKMSGEKKGEECRRLDDRDGRGR